MIKKLNILLVEDDDVAAEAVERSLKKIDPEVTVVQADNGKIGLDILNHSHSTLKIQTPFVVLLDLNMPVMNGFEFLEQIRSDLRLKDIVIFVLTTSNDDHDRTRAYHNNVAGYMVKSAVGPQFAKLATLLEAYKNAVEMNE